MYYFRPHYYGSFNVYVQILGKTVRCCTFEGEHVNWCHYGKLEVTPPSECFHNQLQVPMAGLGTMLSGYVIQRFRLSCARTIKFCILLLIASLLFTPMYFIYCDHDQLVGIETNYFGEPAPYDNLTEAYTYSLDAKCNQQCACSSTEYRPVCAEFLDGSQVAFYSPCYAGCSDPYNPLIKEYHNCSCVPLTTKGGPSRVKKGYCESKCKGLFGFLITFAPFCFFTFSVGVPLISVVLR